MSYEFIDTPVMVDEIDEGYSSEAVSINGEYIEDEIDGYITLYTSGRESLAKELASVETSQMNGSFVKGSRFAARTIKVGFMIKAEDPEDFRVKFNALNKMLDVEDAEIIFDDEPDKFFIGTPIMDAEVEPGKNAVKGEFQIYCADPFKYSTQVYVAEPEQDGNVYIDYRGTYPSHPALEADFYSDGAPVTDEESEEVFEYYLSDDSSVPAGGEWDEQYIAPGEGQYVFRRKHIYYSDESEAFLPSEDGALLPAEEVVPSPGEETDGNENEDVGSHADCGYVAWFDEDSNIIQCGSVNEPDVDVHEPSEVLVNSEFMNAGNWGTEQQALWAVNSGVLPSGWTKQGSVIEDLAVYYSNKAVTNNTLLKSAKASTYVSVKVGYYKTSKDKKNKKLSYKTERYNQVKVTSITGKASKRTASGFSLALTLKLKTLYPVQSKCKLTGHISINGTDKTFTIKSSGKKWGKGVSKTITATISVTDLSQTDNRLTPSFSMTQSGGNGGGSISSTSLNTMTFPIYNPPDVNDYFLTADSYGSPTTGYSGPTITRQISSSDSFKLEWRTRMGCGTGANDTNQMGAQYIALSDSDNNVIARVTFAKGAAGANGSVKFEAGGTSKSETMQFGYNIVRKKQTTKKVKGKTKKVTVSKTIVACTKTCSITCDGEKIYFSVAYGANKTAGFASPITHKWSYSVSDVAVTRITCGFMQYKNYPALRFNGLYNIKFTKNSADLVVDIPNTFTAGDVLEVDTASAAITLNGERRMDIGALGNDYESFVLSEGMNQIGMRFSSWVTYGYEPTYKVKYREVFL